MYTVIFNFICIKMQSNVCHSCRKPLKNEKDCKNIFDDDLLVKSSDSASLCSEKWCMKVIDGIELITGQKVTKRDNFPEMLCDVCFQSVEAFISFRHQLLKSRDIFLYTLQQSSKNKVDIKCVESEGLSSENISNVKSDTNKINQKLQESSLLQHKLESISSLVKNPVNYQFQNKSLEDLINVDDSSNVSYEVDDLNKRETDIKQRDHDIESEIDVVSGEEDDVLELDVQKTKNETVEINSSSDTDIDVCDYEPVGKRGSYSSLTPFFKS